MNDNWLIAQLVGLIGIVLLITTFQVNKRRQMLRIQIVSSVAWVMHYVLLGAMTGAGFNLLAGVRSYLFDKYRKRRWILWVMIIAGIAMVFVTWKNWTSMLPMFGNFINTLAFWQKNPRHIRFLSLLVPPCWFAYNMLNGSIPGMIGDTVMFVSVLAGIYRFDALPFLRRREPKQEGAKA